MSLTNKQLKELFADVLKNHKNGIRTKVLYDRMREDCLIILGAYVYRISDSENPFKVDVDNRFFVTGDMSDGNANMFLYERNQSKLVRLEPTTNLIQMGKIKAFEFRKEGGSLVYVDEKILFRFPSNRYDYFSKPSKYAGIFCIDRATGSHDGVMLPVLVNKESVDNG